MSGAKIIEGLQQAIEGGYDVVHFVRPDARPGSLARGDRVIVIGHEFEPYEATFLAMVRKLNGTLRVIVEDRGRLFIQKPDQIKAVE